MNGVLLPRLQRLLLKMLSRSFWASGGLNLSRPQSPLQESPVLLSRVQGYGRQTLLSFSGIPCPVRGDNNYHHHRVKRRPRFTPVHAYLTILFLSIKEFRSGLLDSASHSGGGISIIRAATGAMSQYPFYGAPHSTIFIGLCCYYSHHYHLCSLDGIARSVLSMVVRWNPKE
jgi:hypothetical protein